MKDLFLSLAFSSRNRDLNSEVLPLTVREHYFPSFSCRVFTKQPALTIAQHWAVAFSEAQQAGSSHSAQNEREVV